MNGIVWLMCNWWVSISFLKYCQNCMHHLSFCLTKMVVESFDFACFFAAHYIPPKKRVPQSEYRRYWYLDCAFVLMQDFGCFSRGLVPLQVEVNPLSYHSTTCPSFVLFFSKVPICPCVIISKDKLPLWRSWKHSWFCVPQTGTCPVNCLIATESCDVQSTLNIVDVKRECL